MGIYIGFCVYCRSYLLFLPVIIVVTKIHAEVTALTGGYRNPKTTSETLCFLRAFACFRPTRSPTESGSFFSAELRLVALR